MSKDTLYLGLDTDKTQIDISLAEPLPGGEVRYWGKIVNARSALERVLHRLKQGGRRLVVCYEAGPCGYAIYRWLEGRKDIECRVVAPSMTPRRPGVRVKTNRRDSLTLAKLLRADELSAVWVPDAAHEAMRDLVRARSAAVADLGRCRQRISSLLLRQDVRYADKPWTKKHQLWLGRLVFAAPAHRLLMAELLSALDEASARRDRLTEHIDELVPAWSLAWLVDALQVLRGFRLVQAATLVAEIGDPRRFERPRQLMAYLGHLGLVPSEFSTGTRQRRYGLTKTGNGRARKALIEAAWTYSRPAKTSKASAAPAALRAIAEHRLSGRYRRLVARGKLRPVAAAAIAREQLGFVWAIAHAAAPN